MAKKASAMPDMFASAIKAPKVEEKKKGKEQIQMGRDLDTYAAASAVLKSLEAVKAEYELKLKTTMAKLFSHIGIENRSKPANFEGIGPVSTASCEIRKRSSASVLTDDEANALREKGITLEEKVVREEAYLFNAAILADPVLRKKVSDALAKIDFGGVAPILHQEREVKNIVAEDGIDQLFKLSETEDQALGMLGMVGVLALKPKFDGTLSDAVALLETQAGVKL